MAENQELKLLVTQEGAGPTAQALDAVGAAQTSVAESAEKVAVSADKAAESMDKVAESTAANNASGKDWVALLGKIDPALGQAAATLDRMLKVSSELAKQNLELTNLWDVVTGGVKRYAGALVLMGAAYAAYLAVRRAFNVWAADKEDLAKAADEAKRYERALADLNKQRGQQQQTIEEIAGQRKEGGFKSADDARAAQQQAERARERFSQLKQESVNAVAGNLGDAGLSDDEFIRAAFAVQQNRLDFDGKKTTKENRARTQGAVRANRRQIDRAINLENEQKVEAARVVASAGNKDGIQDIEAIKAAIEQAGLAKAFENVDLLARVFANRGAIAGDDSEVVKHTGPFGTSTRVTKTNEFADAETLQGRGFTESLADLAAATRHMETIARAAETIIRNGAQSPVVNQTFTGTVHDATAAARGRQRNGASVVNAIR